MSALSEAIGFLREHSADVPLPSAMAKAAALALIEPDATSDAKSEFLRRLHDRGEKAEEVAAFAEAFLPLALDPGVRGNWRGAALLDCCGPGGGRLPIVNISTASVFVMAACGVPVVKHGNRGITKASGSADVLEALGLRIELSPAEVPHCLEACGATFLYAPAFHPAFRHIAPVRKALAAEGLRTIFNVLGPVLNPTRPQAQLIGAFEPAHLDLYEGVLRQIGCGRFLIVRGCDGATGRAIGEWSVTGPNEFRCRGEGLEPAGWHTPPPGDDSLAALEVESAAASARRIQAIFSGQDRGLARALTLANASAGICVARPETGFANAWQAAGEAVDSGRAATVLSRWRALFPRS
jgi:anthranilate phosphoribosyltransferase